PDDPFRKRYSMDNMLFRATQPDPIPVPGMPTYRNESTAWWGGNQLYGNDQLTQDRLRTDPANPGKFVAGGKMYLIDGEHLPVDAAGREFSGATQNWWVGRSVFHTLFAKHHNYIAEVLQQAHPEWSSDQLFQTARLVNSAIMAKIHTVE